MKKTDIKILLVDDEPDILEIVGYNLSAQGYQIITAENGVEGVEKAKKHKPQLIVLDVMMPEMDGIEACEQIRKVQGLENVIITFLTARGEDYSQVAGFDAGADDYITKPIKPKVLVVREEILDKVWGSEVVVGGRTIDVHIRKLREKIGDKRIKTIKGVGYKFVE